MYEFLTPKEHLLTVRDRSSNTFAKQHRYWNDNVIRKVLDSQKPMEDIFVTKYPKKRLLQYMILDFDSKENRDESLKEATRMLNFFEKNGHPCVLVDSTNKGYHLYIKISPTLFKNNGNRTMPNWDLFFEEFVRYMIRRSSTKPYHTLDVSNTSAGMKGNIRLIGSVHPSTGERVTIVRGKFDKDVLPPTELQDTAMKVAFNFCDVMEEFKKPKKVKTAVVNGVDPIAENDLRELFPQIYGGEIKHYSNYSMMLCPFHGESHPSLMIWKECYKCTACGEKGNIWTLKKKGIVEFGLNGEVRY